MKLFDNMNYIKKTIPIKHVDVAVEVGGTEVGLYVYVYAWPPEKPRALCIDSS
jgi:hypothetical protein